jgi:putative membrane protein
MRHTPLLIATWLALACQSAWSQQPEKREPIDQTPPPRGTASFQPPPALAEDEPLTGQTFVVRAAIVNIAETDLAELALSRSHDAAIQAYARKMLADYRQAQAKLRAAAAQAKLALPGMADQKHQQKQDLLKRASPDEFDTAYIKAMVSGHDEAVALFDAAARAATLPKVLQNYAIDMLPAVRKHRDAADALHKRQGA